MGVLDGIKVLEMARVPPAEMPGMFLQHVGPHVGQEHPGHLGGRNPRHLQHLDSVQHAHGDLR